MKRSKTYSKSIEAEHCHEGTIIFYHTRQQQYGNQNVQMDMSLSAKQNTGRYKASLLVKKRSSVMDYTGALDIDQSMPLHQNYCEYHLQLIHLYTFKTVNQGFYHNYQLVVKPPAWHGAAAAIIIGNEAYLVRWNRPLLLPTTVLHAIVVHTTIALDCWHCFG
jgi:hypothetical protein